MFGPSGLVSYNDGSHGTLFYAFDERGNTAHRVSASGSLVSTDSYDAFGQRLSSTSSGGSYVDAYGYGGQAGYRTDAETGLSLLTNRYYDPAAGRFVTRDPIGSAGGINLYSYTQNNPGNGMDPDGTQMAAAAPIVAGGVATTAAYVYTYWWLYQHGYLPAPTFPVYTGPVPIFATPPAPALPPIVAIPPRYAPITQSQNKKEERKINERIRDNGWVPTGPITGRIHRRIGDEKISSNQRRNPDLPWEEVEDIIDDECPPKPGSKNHR